MAGGLKINDVFYSEGKLIELCNSMVSGDDTPEWEKNVFSFILDWFDEEDYLAQKTSGTTGESKEIRLLKSSMLESAKRTIEYFQLKENDTVLLCLPVEYIAGKMMIVRAMVGDLNLLIIEPKGLPQLPDRIISFAAMVPLQLQNLFQQNIFLELIDKLLVGGAAINSYIERESQNVSAEIYLSYGMSETCSHIALRRINGDSSEDTFKVLKGIEIETNEKGCLIVKAPSLDVKEIVTSDIVEIVSPGCFKFMGRANNIINSGGIKIVPEKLELEIKEFINGDYIISAVSDDLLGEKLVLVIEGQKEDIEVEDLLEKIKARIGSKYSPKDIVFLSEFPRNLNMKISRKSISRIIDKDKNLSENQ